MSAPIDFLRPAWPAPANIRAIFTTRAGGASKPPFDSFNLGDHVRDDPAAVLANRAALQTAIAAKPVFLNQVHGVHSLVLTAQTPNGAQADACFTLQKNLACTIMVADCLPLLLAHPSGLVVGAAHAGWRGLCGGVIEACVAQVLESFRAIAQEKTAQAAIKNIASMEVWLGPCIGPQAFEVGAEVRDAFAQGNSEAAAHFVPTAHGKYLANLPALARQRLAALGITAVHGNDGSAPWCTHSNPSVFFSHRRDGVSGRMAASIWRV